MSNRGPAISAGIAASLAMGPAAYKAHRKAMRAIYESRRRQRVKALTGASMGGSDTAVRKARAEGE